MLQDTLPGNRRKLTGMLNKNNYCGTTMQFKLCIMYILVQTSFLPSCVLKGHFKKVSVSEEYVKTIKDIYINVTATIYIENGVSKHIKINKRCTIERHCFINIAS